MSLYSHHTPIVAAMGVPVSATAFIAASWWLFAAVTVMFVLVSGYQLVRPRPGVLP